MKPNQYSCLKIDTFELWKQTNKPDNSFTNTTNDCMFFEN